MKRQQRLLLILALGVFSILNTEMGIIGILPVAAAMYQVDIVQAGMLVSLFALGVAIAGPTMPLLFSRFNRKHVMLLVLGVFTICNALAVVASDFQLLLVLRVVPAFFHPVYCALAFSVAAASVAPEDAPRAVARINMGVAAGMVVGVHRVEGQRKVFGTAAQHAPHVPRLGAAQVDEDRIGETHVLDVTASHGLGIERLEGAIEPLDQLGIGMTHGVAPVSVTARAHHAHRSL